MKKNEEEICVVKRLVIKIVEEVICIVREYEIVIYIKLVEIKLFKKRIM